MPQPARRALAFACLTVAAACATPAARTDPWQPVRFLAGAWRATSGDVVSEEIWTEPHGDTMYGQNRTLRRGALQEFELLTIERRGDDLVYVARPGGRAATEFRLVEAGAGTATFANPDHDFPKRIHYRLTSDGSLTAIVEGDGARRFEFGWWPVR